MSATSTLPHTLEPSHPVACGDLHASSSPLWGPHLAPVTPRCPQTSEGPGPALLTASRTPSLWLLSVAPSPLGLRKPLLPALVQTSYLWEPPPNPRTTLGPSAGLTPWASACSRQNRSSLGAPWVRLPVGLAECFPKTCSVPVVKRGTALRPTSSDQLSSLPLMEQGTGV